MLAVDIRAARGRFELAAQFALDAGSTLAVVGPNGSGKTTLLRAIAGLEPAATGSINVGDEVWLGPDACLLPQRRSVGVVFADGSLFPHLSAADNVSFGLEARGQRRRVARVAAMVWLERLGVAHRADALPRDLSSGQARRVALARALVTEPAVLLLDEPLSSLDADSAVSIRRDLADHLRDHAGVALVVSHDPAEAHALADHLLVIEDGRVTNSGTVAEVAAAPGSAYAARWVGTNVLRGIAAAEVVTLGGGHRLVVAGVADGDVVLTIHPHAVSLHGRQPEGTPRNVWATTVSSIVASGQRVRVSLGSPLEIVAEVTPAAVADLGLAVGAAVWAAVKATEIDALPA